MLFQQSTAPVGWTKDVSIDNTALRVTAGTVSSGGTLDFTAAFNSARVPAGSVGSTSLTTDQMPVHSHGVSDPGHIHSINDPGHRHSVNAARVSKSTESGSGDGEAFNENLVTSYSSTGISINNRSTGISISNAGSGNGHTHSFTGSNLDLDVKYQDCIIAEKN